METKSKYISGQNMNMNMNGPAIQMPNNGEGRMGGRPVAPLPNPGEGGPVNGGNGNRPVVPLPNPGEGGPVNGGSPNRPVIPLPNPGEGGPVNGGGPNRPVIPLPNPGEGGPVNGGSGNMPIVPLPNPGEGGPVFPGNFPSIGIVGTIITTVPRPNAPCNFCPSGNSRFGTVRFLNAASDYNPFMVYVNENLFVRSLNYAELTEYEKVPSGSQTITVMGENGYIYIQKQVMITEGSVQTIAIINTATGLDLTEISDAPCTRPYYVSCIRACNLSFNSGPLNVVIGDRNVVFNNVTYKEVTDYKTIWPGEYSYYVSKSGQFQQNILVSSVLTVQNNISYTIYIFNWNKNNPESIRVLVVEERS